LSFLSKKGRFLMKITNPSHRICRLLALALLAAFSRTEVATAELITVTSGGGVVNNSLQAGNARGRNGNYTLTAYAQDSLNGPNGITVGGKAAPYTHGAGPFADSAGPAKDPGKKYAPEATASISYDARTWSSLPSTAVIKPGPDPKSTAAETAKAMATVLDPWSWDPISTDEKVTIKVTFLAGLSIGAKTTGGDEASASIHSDGSTDLNNLGQLWSFDWTTDAKNPGVSTLLFSSNPALGLSDSTISGGLAADISTDLGTGISTLVNDYSFSYDLVIAANATPMFSGETIYEATAASVPEPSPLLLLGALALITLGYRYRRGRAGCLLHATATPAPAGVR
jgi:hypothetical protein